MFDVLLMINGWLMIDWRLLIDWWLIDGWLTDDLMMIDWWLIDWWFMDDWMIIDWWLMRWPYHSFDCVSYINIDGLSVSLGLSCCWTELRNKNLFHQ